MFQGREVIELWTHAKAKKRLTMRSRCIQKTLTPHSCGLLGDIYTSLQVGAKTNEHCGNPWNCVGFIMHEGKLVWSSEWAKLFGLSPFWLLRFSIFSCRPFSILLVQLSTKLVKKNPLIMLYFMQICTIMQNTTHMQIWGYLRYQVVGQCKNHYVNTT